MANPEDPGTSGRASRRNRWGRRQEGTADASGPAPESGGREDAGPRVSEGSDPSVGPSGTPPATDGTQPDVEPEPARTGPHLEYAHPEQTLETTWALGLPMRAPMPVSPPEAPRSEAESERAAGAVLVLPAYLPVDRAVPSEIFARDIPVKNPDTHQVDFVVRRPFGYPSGQFPAQPGRVAAGVDPRTAVCRSLPPRAAGRCLRQGGYF